MQIDHDPNEPKQGRHSTVAIVTSAAILGGGLALYRADWDVLSASDEPAWWAIAAIVGGLLYFVAIHYLLKGWDWLLARLTGGASR